MDKSIYYIAGGLFAIYLFISMRNRNRSKERKSKKFMEGNTRSDRKKEE
ncbi:hypothetical protein JQC67_10050 [Aurantibacter crassamenti]|nr:hypothetical protein [Aurantibacter crassamenti]MBM1106480.1 hypothetical protein [Aurantibacter crassamenti]